MNLYESKVISSYYFQSENLGLMDSIHFAADWFFDKVECGLILEDDLIINSPGLDEAELLWGTVCKNIDVTVLSLGNPLPAAVSKSFQNSFWCSNFFVSYAWATSRETWKQSARSINDLDLFKIDTFIKSNYGNLVAWNFRRFISVELRRETYQRKKCSFAWRFSLDQISKGNTSLIASKNRIGYTGFGRDSTNTIGNEVHGSDFGRQVDLSITPWVEPHSIRPDVGVDYYFLREFGMMRTIQSKLAVRTRIRNALLWVSSIIPFRK
jgi:hypothetical protein